MRESVYIVVYEVKGDYPTHRNIMAFVNIEEADRLASTLNLEYEKLPARYFVEEVQFTY